MPLIHIVSRSATVYNINSAYEALGEIESFKYTHIPPSDTTLTHPLVYNQFFKKKMADVVVVSETIVRPESNEDGSDRVKIHLTPWDLIFLRTEYAQRALILPKPDPKVNVISQLKSSLSAA